MRIESYSAQKRLGINQLWVCKLFVGKRKTIMGFTVDFGLICRDAGKIFIRAVSGNLPGGYTLEVESFIGEEKRSCLLFPDETKAYKGTNSSWIVVAPQFLRQELVFVFRDPKRNIVSSVSKSLSLEKIKWLSRYHYRANRNAAFEIRNYDAERDFDLIRVDLFECISENDKDIFHGALYVQGSVTSSVELECCSEQGEIVSSDFVHMGEKLEKLVAYSNRAYRKILFSIKVKKAANLRVFQVKEADTGRLLRGFKALERDQYEKIEKGSQLFSLNAQVDPAYHQWFIEHRVTPIYLKAQREYLFKHSYKFSIIVPLYKTPLIFFDEMVESVKNQSYESWELILVNASPEDLVLSDRVQEVVKEDPRIKVIKLEKNLGITLNTNAGVDVATGDFICFFDHDDILEPDLLFEYARALEKDSDIDLLYCDEDKLLKDGFYSQPFFKPDFSIDLLRNNNYICHMLTVRKSVLDALPKAGSEFDGAQDHNLTLKVSEVARKIQHISKVLYHWRMSETSTAADADSKPYATSAGIKAVSDHLERLGIKADVEQSRRPFTYKITYAVTEEPLVSIIIPSKDAINLLDQCVTSIIEKSTYPNYEIVIIENNSTNKETFEYYEKLQSQYDFVRVVTWEYEFNFSKLMNYGALHANGEYLILLNNDTEALTVNWIERMLGICQRDEVGIVGVRLLYKDNTIQHAGLCVTGGVAGHLNRALPKGDWGYFALADAEQNFSAVTAACLMVEKSLFNKVGGFTEDLAVAFNDVDFCLKVREAGKLIVYTPEVELYHYESISRGDEDTLEKKVRFHKEVAYMNDKWATFYMAGDPYFNKNFDMTEPYNRYYRLPHFE